MRKANETKIEPVMVEGKRFPFYRLVRKMYDGTIAGSREEYPSMIAAARGQRAFDLMITCLETRIAKIEIADRNERNAMIALNDMVSKVMKNVNQP